MQKGVYLPTFAFLGTPGLAGFLRVTALARYWNRHLLCDQ
jgi:hypothetical protein